MKILMNIILTASIIICIATDIKTNKILNKVTFPTMILGLVLSTIQPLINQSLEMTMVDGLLHSILGIAAGFLILLVPYLMGGLFAGDVKFLMAIGSFMGWLSTLYAAIYMALIGGLLAIFNILYKNGFKNGFGYIIYLISFGSVKPTSLTSEQIKDINKSKMPYGIAIGLGAIVQLYWGVLL